MKTQEIKTIWKVARLFLTCGFCIWALETGIFLIIEGWHLSATSPVEKWLDKVSVGLLSTGLNLAVFSCFSAIMEISSIKNN